MNAEKIDPPPPGVLRLGNNVANVDGQLVLDVVTIVDDLFEKIPDVTTNTVFSFAVTYLVQQIAFAEIRSGEYMDLDAFLAKVKTHVEQARLAFRKTDGNA